MRSTQLLSLAASVSAVSAVYTGFNYGSTQTDGSVKAQSDFQSEFSTAKSLVGASGFTSARLYTMIQGGTTNTPIAAIPAAIAEDTTLLLGMWASAGQADFDNELAALTSAISQYGDSFTKLVAAISVGSEDLYRVSPTGIQADSGAGADPDTITSYISQVRSAIANTGLSSAPVGHVDTWTAWVNSSNDAVISACDWIGMDAYPYFQNTMSNDITDAKSLFFEAYDNTVAAAEGKDVWITETGWPISGKTENLGVPSLENAQTYWDEVACETVGKYNTFWYTLQDAYPTTPNPSFGLVGSTLTTTPLYDLSCSNVTVSSSSSASTSATSSMASGTASTSVLATGSSGLTPSEGSGNGPSGSVSATVTGSSSIATSTVVVATSKIVTANGTVTSVSPSGTGAYTSVTLSTTGSPSATVSVVTGAAAIPTGSFVGAIGAILAVVAAL